MKKTLLFVSLAAFCAGASAESLLTPINDLGYGTWNARLQTLSMYRDVESPATGPENAYSTTAGLLIGYTSPELAGFSAGGTWIYVEPVDASEDSNNGKIRLQNGRVNILNEAWLKYRFESLGLTNTFVKAGRQVLNGELFRSDEIRQKPRSVEAVQLTTKDVPGFAFTGGHAWRLSNVLDDEDGWEFNDFDEVFTQGKGCDSRGITWGEAVFTGVTNLEVAVYEAYVHDIANVTGGRTRYALTDTFALLGYFQHADSVQTADSIAPFNSDMFSLAVEQKVGGVTFEPGWFSVHGDSMLFHETSTGLNHPLGAPLLIYSGPFNGGSDSAYLKATTKIGKTSLYMLYDYTWQDHNRYAFDGQEINFVVKQPINDSLSVTVKVGAGYQDRTDGKSNTTATDARLFVTYNF
ncbi:MAG: OprD family outer membrane porin [Kiritimatiellales bacterium]